MRDESFAKVILAVVVVFVAIIWAGSYVNSNDTIIAKVTDKTVKRYGENGDKYLVFTDKESFESTDSWLFGKFNSSDVYGRIEVGSCYKFTVAGWRFQFFSMYRNIIEVENRDCE